MFVDLPTPTPVMYSAPLVIRKGGVYRGNWESLDANVPAVLIETDEPVVIENSTIRGRGDLIRGWWVNLTVRNSRAYGLNANVVGKHSGRFISAEDVKNLVVENNAIEGTSGIYAHTFRGDPERGQTIKILRNRARNIDGRHSNGMGGYRDDSYRVQFLQFNKIRNVPNIEIGWNEVINEPGKSFVEEIVNIYSSSGTEKSPIKIHNNFFQGAYALNPATETKYSGGGIVVGDGDIDDVNTSGGYVDVFDNQIVSTSNQGIGIAGGHNHNVYNNRVVSSGRLPDGRFIAAQNVGIYVWDVLDGAKRKVWFKNSVRDNVIGWTRRRSDGTTYLNNTWFPSCSTLCYNNRALPVPITLDVERAELELWREKVRKRGVAIGPRDS